MTFLKTVKEIKSQAGEVHFKRFAIFQIYNFCSLYVHFIYKSDKDPYTHSHPWNFLGVILKGGYLEQIYKKDRYFYKKRTFGSILAGSRNYFHKIQKVFKPTISLFLVWGEYKPWHYNLETKLVESGEYRKEKKKYERVIK